MAEPRPVVLVAVGGTIATSPGPDGRAVPTRAAAAVAGDLAKGFTAVVDFRSQPKPGPHLTMDDCVELAAIVRQQTGFGHGVVVTTGTDTLEEVAFALDAMVSGPVVVTGAMRPPEASGSDAMANLGGAWVVAAQGPADLGVTAVLSDEVHAAARVRKADSASPGSFSSGLAGVLGRVAEGELRLANRPAASTVKIAARRPVPAVALLTALLGDDGAMTAGLETQRYRGLVYEAFGGGHWNPVAGERIRGLAARMPVVVTTRTRQGPLFLHTYDFEGSERDLLDAGVMFCDSLDGLKARVLLALALSAGLEPSRVFRSTRHNTPGD